MRPGQRIGKYILGDPIARGGMAEVWAARVEGPEGFVKTLALKFILETFKDDVDLERLFVNEARVAAQLQHANLVSVFDFDVIHEGGPGGPSRYFIAMERVEGPDLRRILQVARHKAQRVPPPVALHIAGEVLKALRYVHERREADGSRVLGLVHRDVSPHNVLVGMGGEVKLSDFGIAKAMSQSLGTGRAAGTIRGKLAYASPEQLRGEPIDHRTDQFGAGVTLWEMLAGERLFDGANEAGIIGKVLQCEIRPIARDAGVDPEVEGIVRRMLAIDVGGRFPSTAEALAAVRAAPGYTADPSGVVELMRELFAPRPIALPRTVPLRVPDLSGIRGSAETSPLGPAEPEGAGGHPRQTMDPAFAPDRARGEGLARREVARGAVSSATATTTTSATGAAGATATTAELRASRLSFDGVRRKDRPPRSSAPEGDRGAARAEASAPRAAADCETTDRRGLAGEGSSTSSGYLSSASLIVAAPTGSARWRGRKGRPVRIAVVATAALSAAVGTAALITERNPRSSGMLRRAPMAATSTGAKMWSEGPPLALPATRSTTPQPVPASSPIGPESAPAAPGSSTGTPGSDTTSDLTRAPGSPGPRREPIVRANAAAVTGTSSPAPRSPTSVPRTPEPIGAPAAVSGRAMDLDSPTGPAVPSLARDTPTLGSPMPEDEPVPDRSTRAKPRRSARRPNGAPILE